MTPFPGEVFFSLEWKPLAQCKALSRRSDYAKYRKFHLPVINNSFSRVKPRAFLILTCDDVSHREASAQFITSWRLSSHDNLHENFPVAFRFVSICHAFIVLEKFTSANVCTSYFVAFFSSLTRWYDDKKVFMSPSWCSFLCADKDDRNSYQ